MVTQFTIGFSRTINLGNFESARVEASVVVSLEGVEDMGKAAEDAQVELRRLLEETYQAQYKKRQAA